MDTIKLGLIGFGTIGTGVVKTLQQQCALLETRVGARLELTRIADVDITRAREVEVDRAILTTNAQDVLNDPEIQLVIELMGGYEPARSFVLQAIRNGKHVVTANKALLAVHGPEIFDAATAQHVDIGFEASVGGGIPIIRSLREGFVANRFEEIYGILNGTTNYILTEMTENGEAFRDVLQRAQQLGLAEPNPTFDIEGIDPAHKIIILTYLGFDVHLKMEQVFTEGISKLDALDIKFARELGYIVKLLAIAKQKDQALEVRVHPTMVPDDHLLATVDGSFNAIYVVGDIVGSTMFYGRGAGMMPTASAVIGDVVDIARNIRKKVANKVPLVYPPQSAPALQVQAPNQFLSRYYLRFTVMDQPGVLSKIAGILAEYNISIASVIQKEKHPVDSVPVVILTHEAYEHNMQQALAQTDQMDVVKDKTVLIRVL